MKKFFLLILLLCTTILCISAPIEVDNIYYDVTSPTTVCVTKASYIDDWHSYYKGNITIPSHISYEGKTYEVTSIGKESFQSQTQLTSIYIPVSVERIDYRAFSGCVLLEKVNVSSNSCLSYIGNEAFYGCKSLKIFNSSLIDEIGESAFKDCISLNSIPIINKIGRKAFQNCLSLTSVNIYSREIGELAFWACKNLRDVIIYSNCNIIGNGAFMECSSLYNVKIEDGVQEIGYEAFRWCLNLKKIVLPSSVETIGYGIFRYCTGLEDVVLSDNIKEIPSWAFEQTNIKKIVLPKATVKIMPYAFIECVHLETVIWSDNLTDIHQEAFAKTSLYNIDLPESIREIGVCAFMECVNVNTVTIPNSVIKISDNAFLKCSRLTDAYVYGTIPPAIPYNTGIFKNCSTPVKVHVLEGYKEIYETSVGWAYNVDNHQTVIIDDLRSNQTTGIETINTQISPYEVIMKVTGNVYIIKTGNTYKKVIIK